MWLMMSFHGVEGRRSIHRDSTRAAEAAASGTSAVHLLGHDGARFTPMRSSTDLCPPFVDVWRIARSLPLEQCLNNAAKRIPAQL